MNRKYIILLSFVMLALVFVVILLMAESNYDNKVDTLVESQPITEVIFISSWAGHDTKAQWINKILSEFQKEVPGYEIVNKSIGGEDFLISLKTDFVSGKEPDVFGLWPGSDIEMLVEKNKVMDLTKILEEDPTWYQSFGKEAWEYVTIGEGIYGLPFELIYEGLFINEDMFNELGLEIPSTYDELLIAVKEIRIAGSIPIAFNDSAEGSYLYQNIVMSLGGKEDIENPFDASGKIKRAFIDGMYYMKELYEANAFPTDAFILSDYERNQLFITKRAAMIVQGSWFIGQDSVNPNDRSIAIKPFPKFKESKAKANAIIYGCGNGVFHMSQNAADDDTIREVSINMLKELTSQEAALTLINENGGLVNINVPDYLVDASPLYYSGRNLVDTAGELIGPVDSFIDRDIWEDYIVAKFPLMLRGDITPEMIFDDVNKLYIKRNNL